MKAELKVKLDMAKFLQQTLDDMALQGTGRSSQVAKDFAEFIHKVRLGGLKLLIGSISLNAFVNKWHAFVVFT